MTEKKLISLGGVLEFVENNNVDSHYAGIIKRALNIHPGALVDKELARKIRKGELDKAELFRAINDGRGKGKAHSSDSIKDEKQTERIFFTSMVPR